MSREELYRRIEVASCLIDTAIAGLPAEEYTKLKLTIEATDDEDSSRVVLSIAENKHEQG